MNKLEVPGNAGWPLVGDKSIQFYQNPEDFLEYSLNLHKSDIFLTRIFNTPTIFVCGYQETKELLKIKEDYFQHGYDTFLYNSYGDNLLFQSGTDAVSTHNKLCDVFSNFHTNTSKVEKIMDQYVESLICSSNCVDIYSETKAAMTKLCLVSFLDLSENDFGGLDVISSLATVHWHGIISLPINLKTPFSTSGWNKALDAKEKLLNIIRDKLRTTLENESKSFCDALLFNFNEKFAEQHLLLFISALIPKAFASLFTSFIYEMAGQQRKGRREKSLNYPKYLQHVLLEVQRLHPPFLGGRRIAKKNTTLGKYKIPKGYSVIYNAHKAHLDQKIFEDATTFLPERWENCNSSLFCFGGGRRECIGTHFIMKILTHMSKQILEKATWNLLSDNIEFKCLPVHRPLQPLSVEFKTK